MMNTKITQILTPEDKSRLEPPFPKNLQQDFYTKPNPKIGKIKEQNEKVKTSLQSAVIQSGRTAGCICRTHARLIWRTHVSVAAEIFYSKHRLPTRSFPLLIPFRLLHFVSVISSPSFLLLIPSLQGSSLIRQRGICSNPPPSAGEFGFSREHLRVGSNHKSIQVGGRLFFPPRLLHMLPSLRSFRIKFWQGSADQCR